MRNIEKSGSKKFAPLKRLVFAVFITFCLTWLPYTILLWYGHDFNPYFLDIDSCLDAGRVWDYEQNICLSLNEKY